MAKLAQREILKVKLLTVDDRTGEETPVLFLDSLKMADFDAKTSVTEVRGGEGSALLTIFESNYDVDTTFQDAVWRPKMSSMISGSQLVTIDAQNKKEIYHSEVVKINKGATATDLEFTLKKEVKRLISVFKSEDGVEYDTKLMKASTAPTAANEYQVAVSGADTKITLHADAVATADTYIIVDYTYEISNGTIYTLDFTRFSTCTFKLVGHTIYRDINADGCEVDRRAQVVIPRIRLMSNQKFEFKGEGNRFAHCA